MQGVWVQSLVEKLGSHMPRGQKTNIKQKQYWSKLDKDFKNGPHKKNILKKIEKHNPCPQVFLTIVEGGRDKDGKRSSFFFF